MLLQRAIWFTDHVRALEQGGKISAAMAASMLSGEGPSGLNPFALGGLEEGPLGGPRTPGDAYGGTGRYGRIFEVGRPHAPAPHRLPPWSQRDKRASDAV